MKTPEDWADYWENTDGVTLVQVIKLAMAQAWEEGRQSAFPITKTITNAGETTVYVGSPIMSDYIANPYEEKP